MRFRINQTKTIYCALIIFALMACSLLLLGSTADAAPVDENYPIGNNMPSNIRDYLLDCGGTNLGVAQASWVSLPGQPNVIVANVPYNSPSVNLQYNAAAIVCRPGVLGGLISTNNGVVDTDPVTPSLTGKELLYDYPVDAEGYWSKASTDFSFTPDSGNFTSSGWYSVSVSDKRIHRYSKSPVYRCVGNPGNPSNQSDFSKCPSTGGGTFSFYIQVDSVSGCTNSSATNYNPAANVDDRSCVFPVPGCTDSGAVNYNPAATTDDGSCVYDVCNNISGNQAEIPSGYSSNGSGGCEYPAPSCGPANNFSTAAGLPFSTKKLFKNDNSVDMPITNAVYSIGSVVPASSASPASVNIAPGDTSEFSSSAHTIDSPGVYTITWTVNYEFGTKDCSDDITVTVVDPVCSVSTFSIGTRDKFVPRVTVENENYVPLNITSASYLTDPTKISGNAAPDTAPGRVSTTFDAPETIIDTPGEYVLIWTVQWSAGTYLGTISCQTDASNRSLVSNQPYARFYGNDLFAGGGFGSNCNSSGPVDALGFGGRDTNQEYIGTASELAVFATGQIQNVLPGSQRSRIPLQELAFANVGSWPVQVDPATGKFGGGFGSVSCSPDYYAKAPVVDRKSDTVVDLSLLESGNHMYGTGLGSTTAFSTGSGVPDGRKLIVYIDGNVQINDSGSGRFGYSNIAGSWASFSDMPSLYIIASGNIYVQRDIAAMDGVYVAQPRFEGDDTTGDIYSCANGANNPLFDLGNTGLGGNAEFILNNCNTKLIVNGAFMASRVHLLRSNNTVNDGVAYETSGSNNVAEVFQFTPELYITEGGGLPPRSTNVVIDSIVALPPNF